ncbi:conserved hypothetical protein [Bathymodiolus platifrons methanotrophic gill symbiont]|uniref:tyrosine-type recombinase/integrase n=1 Tax=Bathymodiolus platifrons methanotrophic gill symbiont TaxID=113268 RepID=UPI000B41A4F5|nr:tyrosine-type recombinase/integrase [Bathymodiolus platifrons methanotrophic gill symbiont]GAW87511.1 conserved hypothetical protein [Bathymodiolus platifrons methanotrophic gill symbiont]GFO75206.1 hypothetical protein BPLS_P2284 [Bathymodiolus platifrons methanotrophic gill symbiont]
MKSVVAANKSEIQVIHSTLEKKFPSIYADVWKIGCQLSLRISDLLSLKYAQLDIDNREVTLTESKTNKIKHIRLNSIAVELIQKRRKQYPDDIYLFQVHSNRTASSSVKNISRVSVSRVFKQVGDMLGLNINTHSMRKSRGKAMYDGGVPVTKIAKVLNHSSEAATLRYLGITAEDVLQTYDDFEL